MICESPCMIHTGRVDTLRTYDQARNSLPHVQRIDRSQDFLRLYPGTESVSLHWDKSPSLLRKQMDIRLCSAQCLNKFLAGLLPSCKSLRRHTVTCISRLLN